MTRRPGVQSSLQIQQLLSGVIDVERQRRSDRFFHDPWATIETLVVRSYTGECPLNGAMHPATDAESLIFPKLRPPAACPTCRLLTGKSESLARSCKLSPPPVCWCIRPFSLWCLTISSVFFFAVSCKTILRSNPTSLKHTWNTPERLAGS